MKVNENLNVENFYKIVQYLPFFLDDSKAFFSPLLWSEIFLLMTKSTNMIDIRWNSLINWIRDIFIDQKTFWYCNCLHFLIFSILFFRKNGVYSWCTGLRRQQCHWRLWWPKWELQLLVQGLSWKQDCYKL